MGTEFRLKYLIRFAFGSRGVFFYGLYVLWFRFSVFRWFVGVSLGWRRWWSGWFSVGAWVGSHTLFDSLKNKQNSIQTAIEFSTNRLRNSILVAFKCSKFGGLIFQVGDFVRSIYSLVTGLVYRNQKTKLKVKTKRSQWTLHLYLKGFVWKIILWINAELKRGLRLRRHRRHFSKCINLCVCVCVSVCVFVQVSEIVGNQRSNSLQRN